MKSKFLSDFKAFAMRGNAVDMALGIIIGGAFGKIVSSLVTDILMPLIGILIGGIDFNNLKWVIHKAAVDNSVPEVAVTYGKFIQSTVDFLIITFSIFLFIRLIQKLFNNFKKKETTPTPAPKPEPSEAVRLLTDIRNLMKKESKF